MKKYFGSEFINSKGRANNRMLKAAENIGGKARCWARYKYLLMIWTLRREKRQTIFLN